MAMTWAKSSNRISPSKPPPFARWKRRFAWLVKPIPRASLARTLPCLLLCASCAATPSAPTPPEVCFIPQAKLQPTPLPPLQDETYGQLRQEADQDRKQLLSCNSDKSIALQILEKQNQQRKASAAGSNP